MAREVEVTGATTQLRGTITLSFVVQSHDGLNLQDLFGKLSPAADSVEELADDLARHDSDPDLGIGLAPGLGLPEGTRIVVGVTAATGDGRSLTDHREVVVGSTDG